MKKYLILVCLTITSVIAFSQENWKYNFTEAQSEAKLENKKLMLVFSGSDWCMPCIRFKDQILVTDVFEEYADKNLVIVNVDYITPNSLPTLVKAAIVLSKCSFVCAADN